MSEAVHEQTSGGFLNVITFGGMSRARKAGLIAGEQEIANTSQIPGVVTMYDEGRKADIMLRDHVGLVWSGFDYSRGLCDQGRGTGRYLVCDLCCPR